jgi:ATP-dependent DNA ligase
MRKRTNIMLAHPAEPKRISKLGDSFYVQPKLNGVRCTCEFTPNGEAHLYSSTGLEKPFLDHIKQELEYFPRQTYDGELYKHGEPWNWINSRASRTENPHPLEEELEYHIFDIISEDPQYVRFKKLLDLKSTKYIKIQSVNEVTQETWPISLDLYINNGYEGIIFRNKYSTYEKKRSPNLLKFKPSETDIYKIKDLVQGTGWCHDRLGAFLVEDKYGNQFEVGTGPCLTKEGRLSYWGWRNMWKGKYLLVKHELLRTKNGFPQCAVAVEALTNDRLQGYLKEKHNDLI